MVHILLITYSPDTRKLDSVSTWAIKRQHWTASSLAALSSISNYSGRGPWEVSPRLYVLSLKQADGFTYLECRPEPGRLQACWLVLLTCNSQAKWHFSLFVCQRKDYTLEWHWWADIFLVVTLEKHIEFFNHLKVILSERTEIIQFGPNLPERQRPLQQLTFSFRNPNPLPEILKRQGTSPCTSVCDFQDEDRPARNPSLLFSLEKHPQMQSWLSGRL